ncbi:MAG: sarcosine oxidase subunit gamma [Alphaproteobacteria bacterium]|nr:MAG: sarcosine oxidase subunit gamma [Alphaproteobacteria bacterium]
MAETAFHSRSPLGGHAQSFGPVRLSEVEPLGVVALAIPLGGEAALGEAVRAAWGIALPAPGFSETGADGLRLVRSAPDQLLALVESAQGGRPALHRILAGELNETALATEQTDAWVALRLAGEGAVLRECLARIITLDLHPDAFAVGSAVRTRMEHLAGLVIREEGDGASDSFLLLSARSSALSFLHAVETSIVNVI